ncbi:MAG: hypothetical protein BGP13_04380 [Sphingobacteriales bacterium 40-81]|nr:MAG: hypothetical protein BGP13_04380 [Sphingobacteriales bacterium 40-81]
MKELVSSLTPSYDISTSSKPNCALKWIYRFLEKLKREDVNGKSYLTDVGRSPFKKTPPPGLNCEK